MSGPRVAFYPCTHSSRRVGLESLCVASELNQGSLFVAQPNNSHSLTDVGQGSVYKPCPSHLKGGEHSIARERDPGILGGGLQTLVAGQARRFCLEAFWEV